MKTVTTQRAAGPIQSVSLYDSSLGKNIQTITLKVARPDIWSAAVQHAMELGKTGYQRGMGSPVLLAPDGSYAVFMYERHNDAYLLATSKEALRAASKSREVTQLLPKLAHSVALMVD